MCCSEVFVICCCYYLCLHYLLLPSVALVVLLCLLDEMNETNEGGHVKKVQTNTFRLHYLRLHYLRLHYLRPHYLLLPSIALVVLLCVLDKMNETNEGGVSKKFKQIYFVFITFICITFVFITFVRITCWYHPLLWWCYFAYWTR